MPALATEAISSTLLPRPALKLCQTEIQKHKFINTNTRNRGEKPKKACVCNI